MYAVCTITKAWIGLVQDVSDEHGYFLSISCILMDRPICFIGHTKITCVGLVKVASFVSLMHHL